MKSCFLSSLVHIRRCYERVKVLLTTSMELEIEVESVSKRLAADPVDQNSRLQQREAAVFLKERLQSLVPRGEIYHFRVVRLFSFCRSWGLNAFKLGQEQATMRRRCLGVRWESPRKQWPCSSTREMAKLLPSAGIVEKVFNYLIDRVTGANATPSGVSCCTAAKLQSQKGTTLEGTTRVVMAHGQILV